MIGFVETPVGRVPRVSASLARVDHWGTVKARIGVGRMRYTVEPGLYALGHPDQMAPVLVTANYKMSFDALRCSVPRLDAWILVLDTHGINVWCAAGKGTFGTREITGRIASSGLEEVVAHRRVILPQLGGPGVSAHQVKKLSGFQVVYGPIRARDLAPFLEAGLKATGEMRRRGFGLRERAVLVPIEVVKAPWAVWVLLPLMFLLGGLAGDDGFWASAWNHGLFPALAVLASLIAGAAICPLLLPWLPGRAFSLKGLSLGAVAAALFWAVRGVQPGHGAGQMATFGTTLLFLAITSFLAMNFTGASTYTSLSGVKKEMRWALPLQIAGAVAGVSVWAAGLFLV